MYIGSISAGNFYGKSAFYGGASYGTQPGTQIKAGGTGQPLADAAVRLPGADTGASAAESPAVIYTPSGMKPAGDTAKIPGQEAMDGEDGKKVGGKSSPEECQTCKERKYKDGSDENVSFKAAAHIAPGAAGAVVRAHEGEHVSNAFTKAAQNNGKVVNASVSIHTAICPECGRTYVSGGTTNTTIKYSNEKNPYQQNRKSQDALRFRGKNIDYAA